MIPISDPNRLLPVIIERLPVSSHVYNQILFQPKFPGSLLFYTDTEDINDKTWILTKYVRKNGPAHFSISSPPTFTTELATNFKDCLAATDAINWKEHFKFLCVTKAVSKLIFDVSVHTKRAATTVWPNLMYKMSNETALASSIPNFIDVHSLSANNNDEKCLSRYWNCADAEADIRECLILMPSAGVFVEGECVAGVSMFPHGLISGVYTLEDHRKRGYGSTVMKFVAKQLAQEGGIPCTTVEERNLASIKMHEALGMEVVDKVDWVEVLTFPA